MAARYGTQKAIFVAKMAGVYSTVWEWNHSGENADLEDELNTFQKDQFHINWGRDERTGEPIVKTDPTPLDDFLRMAGYEGMSTDMIAALRKEKTWAEVGENWVENGKFWGVPGIGYAVDTAFEKAGPVVKLPAAAIGLEAFPSGVTNLRIRPEEDRWVMAIQAGGLGELDRFVEAAVGRKGDVTVPELVDEYFSPFGHRISQASRNTYFDVMTDARQFQARHGKTLGAGGGSSETSPAKRKLNRMLQSKRFDRAGDAFREAVSEAEKANVGIDFSQSVRRLHPLLSIDRRFRTGWVKELMVEKKVKELPIGTKYERFVVDTTGAVATEEVVVDKNTPRELRFVGRRMFKYIRAVQYWENTFVKGLEMVMGDDAKVVP